MRKIVKVGLLNQMAIPIGDYFRTLRRREVVTDWVLPFFCCVLTGFLLLDTDTDSIQTINPTIITFCAIMVGFSVTALSIISVSSSPAVDALKKHMTKRKVLGKEISLYRLLLINFIYLLDIEFAVVFLGIFHLLLRPHIDQAAACWTYLPIVFLFLHSVVLNVRNISNFYLSFSSPASSA